MVSRSSAPDQDCMRPFAKNVPHTERLETAAMKDLLDRIVYPALIALTVLTIVVTALQP